MNNLKKGMIFGLVQVVAVSSFLSIGSNTVFAGGTLSSNYGSLIENVLGQNNVATAKGIVYITRGGDLKTAQTLQKKYGGEIIHIQVKSGVPIYVTNINKIKYKLKDKDVIVLGGTAALSKGAFTTIKNAGVNAAVRVAGNKADDTAKMATALLSGGITAAKDVAKKLGGKNLSSTSTVNNGTASSTHVWNKDSTGKYEWGIEGYGNLEDAYVPPPKPEVIIAPSEISLQDTPAAFKGRSIAEGKKILEQQIKGHKFGHDIKKQLQSGKYEVNLDSKGNEWIKDWLNKK